MVLHGKNLIGNSLSAKGSETFNSFEVATGNKLETVFYEATEDEIDAAVTIAANAFGTYKNKSGKEKAVFLECIATEIEALGEVLIATASAETGLPIARITGERGRTTGQLRLFATMIAKGNWIHAIIDTAQPDRKPLPRADIRQMQLAVGPVAVFGASNFPLAFSVAGGDTVSALAAGCPVVFKAHPAHPATCELVGGAIVNAAIKCNMPVGVFSLLHGKSNAVGEALVKQAAIKAVGFTGSFRGGKALYDIAVKRAEPIPVYAEMSSVNPVVFLPEILKEKPSGLAESFAASIVMGAGQFCTNPGVFLLLKNESTDAFINFLKDALLAKPPVLMLTAGINNAYCNGIATQRQTKGSQGLTPFDGTNPQPHLLQTNVQEVMSNPHLLEEVFGPSTVAIVADDMEALISCCKQMQGQLTATIHGTENELAKAGLLIDALQAKAGRLVINGFPTGVEVCHAMVHGGPFPATTDTRTTSVGTQAIYRFTRPVCYQDFPEFLLPEELKNANPLKIARMVNGEIELDK